MKLRTTHNSIRIRVRKSELALLHQQQRIEESILFPSSALFKFAVVIDKDDESIDARLKNHELVLSIPSKEATKWINSNQVGIETLLPLPDGAHLHVLIEKDFPCIDRPEEDKSDTFWELASEKPDAC